VCSFGYCIYVLSFNVSRSEEWACLIGKFGILDEFSDHNNEVSIVCFLYANTSYFHHYEFLSIRKLN
jgi:hypothetical protein